MYPINYTMHLLHIWFGVSKHYIKMCNYLSGIIYLEGQIHSTNKMNLHIERIVLLDGVKIVENSTFFL